MKNSPTPESCPHGGFVLLFRFGFSLACIALALEVPAAEAGAKRPEGPAGAAEPTLMNPFVVSTSDDLGYLAQNTISGSRLNSKLSDLAAPTTVFTPEFLQDVAATSIDDLYQYMVNTQVTYYEDAAAAVSNDRRDATIRGLPGGRNSINFFQSNLKLDTYNLDRVEFSRGANSILFGLGSPGGVVNIGTKRARFNDVSGSVTLQARSWEGMRTAVDYNQPIVRDRFALRLAAVRDKRSSWRANEWNDQDRLYLTARWKATARTIVDIEGEHGLVTKFDAPTFTARDGYTPWLRAGKTPYTSGAFNAAAGLRNIGANDFIVIDTATGIATNWRGKATTTNNTIDGVVSEVTDFKVLPKESALWGITFPQDTNYTREAIFVNHNFTRNLTAEVAATADYVDRYVLTAAGNSNILAADPNVTLPNGQPNPNAGRAYFEGLPTQNFTHTRTAAIRGSLSYTRDFGKWFGRHAIAGLVEQDWEHFRKRQDHQAILDNPYNLTNPENGANSIHYRTYVDLNGPVEQIRWADWRSINVRNMSESLSGRRISFDWFNFSPAGGADNRFALKSRMAVLQSHWLKERLVTVFGIRKDEQHAWYSKTMVRAPNTGAFSKFAVGDYLVAPGKEDFVSNASNKTFSAVYRALPWLNLTYNHAANAALPSPTAGLPNDENGGRAPNPQGKSEDIGLKIDLGKRAYLSVVYFESSAKNDFNTGTAASGGAEDNFNDIWVALAAAKIALPNGKTSDQLQTRANGYNVDSAAKGYELELIANPTDQWRVFFNLSKMNLVETNLGRDARNYLAKYREFWLSGSNGRVLIDGSGGLAAVADDGDNVVETVAESVKQAETAFYTAYILPDGNRPRGQIKYQANLRTTYGFTEGRLRGFSVGGGVRAQSAPVNNYQIATRRVILGRANTLYDLNFGYSGRMHWLNRHGRWSLQLNVNNVLDETKILPMQTSITTGQIITYRLQTPREFILTAKFEL